MSKIHILTGDDNGGFNAVIHTAVPPGSNSAGIIWGNVLIAAGKNTSVLNVLVIQQAELDQIVAGTVFEFTMTIKKLESGGGANDSIESIVDEAIQEKKKQLQRRYKYYGKNI